MNTDTPAGEYEVDYDRIECCAADIAACAKLLGGIRSLHGKKNMRAIELRNIAAQLTRATIAVSGELQKAEWDR